MTITQIEENIKVLLNNIHISNHQQKTKRRANQTRLCSFGRTRKTLRENISTTLRPRQNARSIKRGTPSA